MIKAVELSGVPSGQLNNAEVVPEHATQRVLNMNLQDITMR